MDAACADLDWVQLGPECLAFLDEVHDWGLNIFTLVRLPLAFPSCVYCATRRHLKPWVRNRYPGAGPCLPWGCADCKLTGSLTSSSLTRLVAMLPCCRITASPQVSLCLQSVAARFFVGLENNYGRYPDILYHNNAHGADVLHSTLCLLNTPVLRRTLSDVEVLSAIVAAAGHDVGHPGLNNAFLTNTGSELAVLYNDLVRDTSSQIDGLCAFVPIGDFKLLRIACRC